MKLKSEDINSQKMHKLLGTVIAPRPIALISTVGADGIYNAAPYSAVTPVSFKPPVMCIASGMKGNREKDTALNIKSAGDFVINMMDDTHIEAVIRTAADYPSNVDEIKEVGLTAVAADRVSSPRIAEARISLECRLIQEIEFGIGENHRSVFFGEVLLFHVDAALLKGDAVDPACMNFVGRLGVGTYCRSTDIIRLHR